MLAFLPPSLLAFAVGAELAAHLAGFPIGAAASSDIPVDVCDQNVDGPCAECVEREDTFCANIEWDDLCKAACCGPTSEALVGCAEECRGSPRCGQCVSFNAPECLNAWQAADESGSFDGFCRQCASEPLLRSSCQLCCGQCDGLDVCNANVDGPCSSCVNREDSFCAANSWDEQCLDVCCGRTGQSQIGCADDCVTSPRC